MLNDDVVAVWSKILLRAQGSKLFLKTKILGDEGQKKSVIKRFAQHGIGEERLILEGPSSRADLLAAYNRIDISLDPFPYPGGTTSVESLWMGVPVVTQRGHHFLSHYGASIVTNAGLSNFIGEDTEDYIDRAVRHGADPKKLESLRKTLRTSLSDSALFNGEKYAQQLEHAFYQMWKHYYTVS